MNILVDLSKWSVYGVSSCCVLVWSYCRPQALSLPHPHTSGGGLRVTAARITLKHTKQQHAAANRGDEEIQKEMQLCDS